MSDSGAKEFHVRDLCGSKRILGHRTQEWLALRERAEDSWGKGSKKAIAATRKID
jgi:hypothetical protein